MIVMSLFNDMARNISFFTYLFQAHLNFKQHTNKRKRDGSDDSNDDND